MLERIRPHVDAWLAARGEPAMDPRRVLLMEQSEGRTEGVLQLVFGSSVDQPLLIAKGAPLDRVRRRHGRPIYEIEYANLETLQRIGMNEGRPTTPEPLGIWRDDDSVITLQAALPGELLKNVPGPELFAGEALGPTLDAILGWWERLQGSHGVSRAVVDDALYEAAVLARLEAFLCRFETTAPERALLKERLGVRRGLLGVELPMFVRHGDWCTANMVRPASGRGIGVFDWEFPLEPALPLFDVFHFFASLRYPYRGTRGESGHFDSFVAVYWGDNALNRELRRRLAELCERHAIPSTALADLFLVSLLEIANLKFEGFVELYGTERSRPRLDSDDAVLASNWRAAGGADKDAPFARIRDGAFLNTRYVAEHGLPALD